MQNFPRRTDWQQTNERINNALDHSRSFRSIPSASHPARDDILMSHRATPKRVKDESVEPPLTHRRTDGDRRWWSPPPPPPGGIKTFPLGSRVRLSLTHHHHHLQRQQLASYTRDTRSVINWKRIYRIMVRIIEELRSTWRSDRVKIGCNRLEVHYEVQGAIGSSFVFGESVCFGWCKVRNPESTWDRWGPLIWVIESRIMQCGTLFR